LAIDNLKLIFFVHIEKNLGNWQAH